MTPAVEELVLEADRTACHCLRDHGLLDILARRCCTVRYERTAILIVRRGCELPAVPVHEEIYRKRIADLTARIA